MATETGPRATAAYKAESLFTVTSVKALFLNTEVKVLQVPSTPLYG